MVVVLVAERLEKFLVLYSFFRELFLVLARQISGCTNKLNKRYLSFEKQTIGPLRTSKQVIGKGRGLKMLDRVQI